MATNNWYRKMYRRGSRFTTKWHLYRPLTAFVDGEEKPDPRGMILRCQTVAFLKFGAKDYDVQMSLKVPVSDVCDNCRRIWESEEQEIEDRNG
jgi:hypothetical protein